MKVAIEHMIEVVSATSSPYSNTDSCHTNKKIPLLRRERILDKSLKRMVLKRLNSILEYPDHS